MLLGKAGGQSGDCQKSTDSGVEGEYIIRTNPSMEMIRGMTPTPRRMRVTITSPTLPGLLFRRIVMIPPTKRTEESNYQRAGDMRRERGLLLKVNGTRGIHALNKIKVSDYFVSKDLELKFSKNEPSGRLLRRRYF